MFNVIDWLLFKTLVQIRTVVLKHGINQNDPKMSQDEPKARSHEP